MTSPLRIAILVNPFTLGMKWGEHAPELARELLGLGHTVRAFGAPPGAIPRSGADPEGAPEGSGPASVGLRGFQPDAIIAYDAFSPAAWLGARTARRLSIPLVLVEAAGGSVGGRGRVFKAIGRGLWGRYVRVTAHAVFALDALAADRLVHLGFSPTRVSTLPSGVDLNAYRPGLASGVLLRHHIRGRILLYVGQLSANRGLDTLVTAFAATIGQRDDWSLVLAGEGSDRSAVRARIDRLGIASQVHWIGAPRDEELPGLMSASTLLAVPALDDSVRGRNIPRAQSCGLPVLASDLPALRYFVHEDVTGLLARPGDVGAWTEMLRRASMSPEARRRWSHNARARAQAEFGWDHVARAFERALGAEVTSRAERTTAQPAVNDPSPS